MELLKDFLTEQWVCVSEARALRPVHYSKTETAEADERNCPFCRQNEHMTPKTTLAFQNTRVIPNKYPALDAGEGGGYGFHEVLIDSPEHYYAIQNASTADVAATLRAIQSRLVHFSRDDNIAYVQVFKNHGHAAGASIFHSHWQLIAMPVTPFLKKTIGAGFERYRTETGRCYLCDEWARDGELAVMERGGVAAFCPAAALYDYCVNITPKEHVSGFEMLDEQTLYDFAAVTQGVVRAMEAVLPELSYNICFHTAPVCHGGNAGANTWHFYAQIIPRVSNAAGFELGSGCLIASVGARQAAEKLRQHISR